MVVSAPRSVRMCTSRSWRPSGMLAGLMGMLTRTGLAFGGSTARWPTATPATWTVTVMGSPSGWLTSSTTSKGLRPMQTSGSSPRGEMIWPAGGGTLLISMSAASAGEQRLKRSQTMRRTVWTVLGCQPGLL